MNSNTGSSLLAASPPCAVWPPSHHLSCVDARPSAWASSRSCWRSLEASPSPLKCPCRLPSPPFPSLLHRRHGRPSVQLPLEPLVPSSQALASKLLYRRVRLVAVELPRFSLLRSQPPAPLPRHGRRAAPIWAACACGWEATGHLCPCRRRPWVRLAPAMLWSLSLAAGDRPSVWNRPFPGAPLL